MPTRASYKALTEELKALEDPAGAAGRARFFKTAAGQYGAGDLFLGLTVPRQRKLAKGYRELPLQDIHRLLASPYHEFRFVALAILVGQFERSPLEDRQPFVDFYLAHLHRVNNWDLVDATAPYILGRHLLQGGTQDLRQLARSNHLWTRRVAIVATLALAKAGQIESTFSIAELLLSDSHDLIHKAIGWALREVGIVNRPELLKFLKSNYARLPRTALRYAIEHFSPEERKRMLTGNFAELVPR